ncbi:MAG TPA: hypothetical protein VF829_03490 [Candidatus Paceibacterota bacterium]
MQTSSTIRFLGKTAILAGVAAPLAASAAPNVTGLLMYRDLVLGTINSIIVPILISIAFITFIIGVYRYFVSEEGSAKRSEGSQFVLYAVIGFAVIFSVWGLVNVVGYTFGLMGQTAPPMQGVPVN